MIFCTKCCSLYRRIPVFPLDIACKSVILYRIGVLFFGAEWRHRERTGLSGFSNPIMIRGVSPQFIP